MDGCLNDYTGRWMMFGWINEWMFEIIKQMERCMTNGWINGQIDSWLDGQINVWMINEWMDGSLDRCFGMMDG